MRTRATYAPYRLHRLVLLWRGMELAVAEECMPVQ